jgi:Asp/Glu/hydantoin racemase
MDYRFDVQLLGSDQRKALDEVESHLLAEKAECSGAGAIALGGSGLANQREEIKILAQTKNPSWPTGQTRLGTVMPPI